MGEAVLFAAIASSALVIGAAIGAWLQVPQPVTAVLLAFASGALITAIAFELFEGAFEHGGALRAGGAFVAGAAVYIAAAGWLERRTRKRHERGAALGGALLAAVTLHGIPENLAMGVALVDSSSVTLLVAIFVSNIPEAIVGANEMRDGAGFTPGNVMLLWCWAAVLLALALVIGYGALEGVSEETLALPLGFAAGALLASLAATVMPQAYHEAHDNPAIAFATAAGFLLSFLIASA